MLTTIRKASFPLAARILSRYCLDHENDRDAYMSELEKADAFALRLINDAPSDRSFIEQVGDFAQSIDDRDDSEAIADARAAIVEYFERHGPGRKCTTPEEAAAEILSLLSYRRGTAGFLLGFAVALRLQAAVAGIR